MGVGVEVRGCVNLLSIALSILYEFGDDHFTDLFSLENFEEEEESYETLLDSRWNGNLTEFNAFLEGTVNNLKYSNEQSRFIKAYTIAKWLDDKFTYLKPSKAVGMISLWELCSVNDTTYIEVGALNSNFRETKIWINPKFPIRTVYDVMDPERPKRLANRDSFYELNGMLTNYSYFRWDGTRTIKNIIVSDEAILDKGNDNVVVAFAPVIDRKAFDTNKVIQNKRGYNISAEEIILKDEVISFVNERIIDDWRLACSEGVDIIFMPETLGTSRFDGSNPQNVEWISKLCQEQIRKGVVAPSITLWPSVWANRENGITITHSDGSVMGIQYKYIPYSNTKEHIQEALRDYEEKENIIIHIPNVHRISTLICSEFLADSESGWSEILCRCLGVSLLLVPSYTPGEQDFLNKIMEYLNTDTTIMWGNCCGAANNFNKCCGAYSKSGRNTMEIFAGGDCHGKCDGVKACIFVVKIPLKQPVYKQTVYESKCEQKLEYKDL
ncbi:hypothetical protein [Butyrivibrio sp. NC2007]|uniref:hypothetical protein n=1 Tax=Butyrivibrio sp. NC2007 TaxID=1280683 RepID=UPI0003B35BEB|nr:hypothetical protein [Butyrivibrio sp. NC2007]